MKPEKVIIVDKKKLPELIEECEWYNIPYQIAEIDKDGKLKFDSLARRVIHIKKQIADNERKNGLSEVNIRIGREDMVKRKNCIKKLKKELEKLTKNET